MTFREIVNRLITDLQTHSGFLKVKKDDIAILKFGEMPAKAPAIYIFAEPDAGRVIVNPDFKKNYANMMIFACTTDKDYVKAALDSIELAERIVVALSREKWNVSLKMSLDSTYSNITVSIVEFQFSYEFKDKT